MLTYLSPAKINLFLHVLRNRDDGFHEIRSLYSAINVFDKLSFIKSAQDSFQVLNAELPTDSANLVIRARDLFREKTRIKDPVSITLEKNIPMEAGLGGGSSNAATTLFALNEMSGFPLEYDELVEIGGQLGADVAFFFSNGLSYCSGFGEILSHADFDISHEFTLAVPQAIKSDTPSAFKNCIPQEISRCSKEFFVNDLEPAVFRVIPELQQVKKDLEGLKFECVTMTGSGSSFFCQGSVGNPILKNVSFLPIALITRDTTRGGSKWYEKGSL